MKKVNPNPLIPFLIELGNKAENVKIVGKTKEERKLFFQKIYRNENKQ